MIFFYVQNGKKLRSPDELDDQFKNLLIKDMTMDNHELRPKAIDVLNHPVLWNTSKIKFFFQDAYKVKKINNFENFFANLHAFDEVKL